MDENVLVQDQAFCLCVQKLFSAEFVKNLSLTFLLQLGDGKRLLEQQSSRLCHHFHNLEKTSEHQPVRNVSKM